MLTQRDKIQRILDDIEDACGHCPVCSPECPLAVSRRAMQGLLYDLQSLDDATP